MAEPIPHDLGDTDQRRARALYGRNMFLCGAVCGGLVGAGGALGFVGAVSSAPLFVGALLLILGLFAFARRRG